MYYLMQPEHVGSLYDKRTQIVTFHHDSATVLDTVTLLVVHRPTRE